MKVLMSVTVALLSVLVVLVAVQTFHGPMTETWSYTVAAPNDEELPIVLNKMGAEGWDVVSARRASSGGTYPTFSYEMILKRRGKRTNTELSLMQAIERLANHAPSAEPSEPKTTEPHPRPRATKLPPDDDPVGNYGTVGDLKSWGYTEEQIRQMIDAKRAK